MIDRAEYFARSLEHWRSAAERLGDPDLIAPPQAWARLEHYLGVSLRAALSSSVDRLRQASCIHARGQQQPNGAEPVSGRRSRLAVGWANQNLRVGRGVLARWAA